MQRKKTVLDRLDNNNAKVSQHRYRYHANIGTFYAHRWLRSGAQRQHLADLQQARDHITQAIELNANAHFGRERYQLMAIEWLLAAPALINDVDATLFWPQRERISGHPGTPGTLQGAGLTDAIEGLSGLIVLGDAWESVDVFLALAMALQSQDHAGLALLARLRVQELLAAGRRSLHPGPSLDSVASQLQRIGELHQDQAGAKAFFDQARRFAADWQAHRLAYLSPRLQAGAHPDTHADFWQDYAALTSAPTAPDSDYASIARQQTVRWIGLGAGGIAVVLGLGLGLRRWRHARQRRRVLPTH